MDGLGFPTLCEIVKRKKTKIVDLARFGICRIKCPRCETITQRTLGEASESFLRRLAKTEQPTTLCELANNLYEFDHEIVRKSNYLKCPFCRAIDPLDLDYKEGDEFRIICANCKSILTWKGIKAECPKMVFDHLTQTGNER